MGKTTLSHTINPLPGQDHLVIHGTAVQRPVRGSPSLVLLLQVLLKLCNQTIVCQNPEFPLVLQHLNSLFLSCPIATDLSVEDVKHSLNRLLHLIPYTVVVLDDIHYLKSDGEYLSPGEAAAADSVLNYLVNLSSRNNVSVVLFSQYQNRSAESLKSAIQLHLTESLTQADIEIMLRQRIRGNQSLECHEEQIVRTICDKAGGNFTLATGLLDESEKSQNLAELNTCLTRGVAGVADLYRRSNLEVTESFSTVDMRRRLTILQTVAAAVEHLSVDSIADVLAFDETRGIADPELRFFSPKEAILRLSDPFIRIDEDWVYFRQRSAQNYVLDYIINKNKQKGAAFLLNVCLSKLLEPRYADVKYCAELLVANLLLRPETPDATATTITESGLYAHATLHWQDYATDLKELSSPLWDKLKKVLTSNSFVSWSENLYILRGRAGIDSQVSVGALLKKWYENLPDEGKPDIQIDDYFVGPYVAVSDELSGLPEQPVIQYLALIRPGNYLNLAGTSEADFERALKLKQRVANGLTQYLGPEDRNTLFARRTLYQEVMGFGRFLDALPGFEDVLRIQRRVSDPNSIDIYDTLQWVGNARYFITDFKGAVEALKEALEGFKRIIGEFFKLTLFNQMCLGSTIEAMDDLEKAAAIYADTYDKWIPDNSNSSGFSTNLLTTYGSLLRKQSKFDKAESMLLEAFGVRLRQSKLTSSDTVDSGMHVAVLYRQWARIGEARDYLDQIKGSVAFDEKFERQCQLAHITALLAFDSGRYEEPITDLRKLVMQSVGESREQNNRELLWIRLDLADAEEAKGDPDSVLSLFTELVVPVHSASRRSSLSSWSDISSPSGAVILETPDELKTAREALALVRDKKTDEAARLLASKELKWAREEDFWILVGGPKVDTDSVRFHSPVT
jgi:tetratricopeptide (TPR) repeat protein